MIKHVRAALLMAAMLSTGMSAGFGQTGFTGEKAAPTYRVVPHSDTQYARELLRLYQPDLIKTEAARAKGTSADLWKAQEIVASWDELAKNRSESIKATADYIAAMNTYLDATPEGIDGVWSLDHAKFITGQLSQAVINRMEYWVNGPKDRAAMAPMADLADRLLKQSTTSLESQVRALEAKAPFDEAAYMRAFNALSEVEYYNVWGQYFKAMAMEPGAKARRDLLFKAAETLGRWADDQSDNGVNKQALLLRGKVRSEAGDLDKAADDLKKASEDGPEGVKSPDWVKYQAQYQIIVTKIRKKDFAAAFAGLDAFKKTLPQDSKEAQMSTEMLRYRITWAEAESKTGKDQKDGQLKALAILADIIKNDPRFRDLIYEQLGAQIPDNVAMNDLLPMQQLAIAYSKSQGQKGDTPQSREHLKDAVKAALAVRDNKSATVADKLEATFLAGVCSAMLNQMVDAVKYNVEFAEMSPKDPRAKDILELALSQIGELRKLPAGSTPELKDLKERALILSTGKFNDPRFRFALGITLEQEGKFAEAAKIYEAIPVTDKNFIDARYHLVSMATTRFTKLTAGGASDTEIKQAASDLFAACSRFISILDTPQPNMQKEAVEHAKVYRTDILMIEAATALNHVVGQPDTALDRLNKLEAVKSSLTVLQQGAILRYRIQALQLKGETDKILPLVQDYATLNKLDPVSVMQGMAVSTIDEIKNIEGSDPGRAKQLADFAVKLFDPIIDQKTKAGDAKGAYELRQIKADMMVRSGDHKGAADLAQKLIDEDNTKIMPYIIQARAAYTKATATKSIDDFRYAQQYLSRVLARLTPNTESYWETWLMVIKCKEAEGSSAVGEIKKTLNDLKLSTQQLGGERYKDDFDRLVIKYPYP